MDDSGILELYFLRNEQAIQETERKYGAYCKTIAGRILKNREDTEETVNDTWLSAWNAIPPQKPNCLQGFLGRITRNGAIDRWRRRTAEKRGGEMELALEELGECIPSGNQVERKWRRGSWAGCWSSSWVPCWRIDGGCFYSDIGI